MHALRLPPQRGFTLTEVMVAMVIAMVGIVMMFQIIQDAEGRKRTTAAGGDAQIAGSIALYHLERDIRPAGNGFGNLASASMNCTVNAYDTTRAPNAFTFQLLPLLITDGAGGAPDAITVLYGNSETAPLEQSFNASTASSKSLNVNGGSGRGGYMLGDLLVVVNNANCGLVEITGNTNGDARTIDHGTTNYNRHYAAVQVDTVLDNSYQYSSGPAPAGVISPRFNNPAGFNTGSGFIYNLGRRDLPRLNRWEIVNNNLSMTNVFHNMPAVEVGNSIINLQAEYGLDTTTPRDFVVDSWQSATPGDWSSVIAVRVALLARSQQFEKTNVTTAAPSWAGGNFTMANVDGTPDSDPPTDNNWRRYRYRVYEVTIPLRNVTWGGSTI